MGPLTTSTGTAARSDHLLTVVAAEIQPCVTSAAIATAIATARPMLNTRAAVPIAAVIAATWAAYCNIVIVPINAATPIAA